MLGMIDMVCGTSRSVTEKEKCYIHYIDNIMRVVWKLLRQHKYLPFNDEFY